MVGTLWISKPAVICQVRQVETVEQEHPAIPVDRLRMMSIVIPAQNEEESVTSTVEHLSLQLINDEVPFEIIVVDDGSTDNTWATLQKLKSRVPQLRPVQNVKPNGIGRAITKGLDSMRGDAVTIMMADGSDDHHDVVSYWKLLNEGYDCVFGSRFIKGGAVVNYPWLKLMLNRLANLFIRVMFGIRLNDTTNAFKAYRKTVIDGIRPIISPHFNILVELPLKAIVRGYTWTVIPIVWKDRRSGKSKLRIKEMGSRYLFICIYVWLEKHFSRGDYLKPSEPTQRASKQNIENTPR